MWNLLLFISTPVNGQNSSELVILDEQLDLEIKITLFFLHFRIAKVEEKYADKWVPNLLKR
jgi:hypothetical protein